MKQVVKIKSKSGGDWTVLQVTTYSSVTFNDVDRAVFTPPQSVRDDASKTQNSVPRNFWNRVVGLHEFDRSLTE
jgi:hypothetical protein